MTSSHFIPDELLSAYLDRQVSEAERRRVEMALAQDPALQERLYALQSVIHLLQSPPAVVVPRPMTISEGQALAAGAFVRGAMPQPGFWQRWMPKLAPLATAIVGVIFVLTLVMPEADLFATFSLPAPSVEQQPVAFQAETMTGSKSAQPTILATQLVEMPVEQPAARGRSAPKPTEAPPAPAAEAQMSMAAAEKKAVPEEMASASDVMETEPERPQEDASAPSSPPLAQSISPLTWLLGALFILLILLTWRVTIAPRRKKRG